MRDTGREPRREYRSAAGAEGRSVTGTEGVALGEGYPLLNVGGVLEGAPTACE